MESIDLSHLLSEEAQASEYIPIKERRKREAEVRAERLGKLSQTNPKQAKGDGNGEEKEDGEDENKPKTLLRVADELKKAKEGLSEETRYVCLVGGLVMAVLQIRLKIINLYLCVSVCACVHQVVAPQDLICTDDTPGGQCREQKKKIGFLPRQIKFKPMLL